MRVVQIYLLTPEVRLDSHMGKWWVRAMHPIKAQVSSATCSSTLSKPHFVYGETKYRKDLNFTIRKTSKTLFMNAVSQFETNDYYFSTPSVPTLYCLLINLKSRQLSRFKLMPLKVSHKIFARNDTHWSTSPSVKGNSRWWLIKTQKPLFIA